MKKNTYLIIITLVTVLCIIIGAFINLRFAGRGFAKAKNAIRKSFAEDDYDFDIDDDYNFDDDTIVYDSEDLEPFHTVSVQGSVLAVVIERGNSYSISTKYSMKRLKPEYSLNNGRLSVVQKTKRKSVMGNNNCKVTITVPYGVTLDKLDIDVDVGAIELSGFDVDTCSISTDVGAVALSKLDFKNMKIKSDVGAVSVELIEDVSLYEIDSSSDLGAIEINGNHAKRKYSQTGSNGKKLKIQTDIGGIEIK